jgi:hypothetical protein
MIALPDNSSICAETIRRMEPVRTGLPSIVTPAAPALADYPNKNQSSVKPNVAMGGACAVPTRRGVACYAPTDTQSADVSLHCLFLAQAVL